jgi:hypothetical protein
MPNDRENSSVPKLFQGHALAKNCEALLVSGLRSDKYLLQAVVASEFEDILVAQEPVASREIERRTGERLA